MKPSLAGMIYFLNEKITGRKTLEYFKKFKKVQQYSGQKLAEFQFEKLKKLLAHAVSYTTYYRELFERAGVDPARMNSFDEFQKVPLLDKVNIRKNPDGFISNDRKRKLTPCATSGSTGHPLIFYLSNERIASNKAMYLLLYDMWGLKIGDREAVLWGSSADVSAYSVAKKIRDGLLHTRLLPAFRMNEELMAGYTAFLKSYRPKNIFGYAHSIYILARFAKNRNICLNDIGLKVIFVTAELLHDFQRELIEEVFGCPVSNCYGGRDSGFIAFECKERRMHLNPNIITEFVRKSGAKAAVGEKGYIVTTDLSSYGMPFIRYKTGDEGSGGEFYKCGCGSSFALMENIAGRDTDYIVNSKGEFIHPLALEYIFRELEGIDHFKIIQKKEDELVLDLAVNSKFNKGLEGSIVNKVHKAMKEPVKLTFRYISENDLASESKYKFVVSEVINKYLQGKP